MRMNTKVQYIAKRSLPLVITALFFAVSCCGNGCAAKQNNETGTKNTEDKNMVQQLTKAEFLTKIANYESHPNEWKFLGDKPAIVDFYADWCGPCKVIAPILAELAKEYEGKIDIYKVDTEKEQDLSAAFGIRSIPTLLFIPMEGEPQIAQGALPKAKLKEIIESVLLKKQ